MLLCQICRRYKLGASSHFCGTQTKMNERHQEVSTLLLVSIEEFCWWQHQVFCGRWNRGLSEKTHHLKKNWTCPGCKFPDSSFSRAWQVAQQKILDMKNMPALQSKNKNKKNYMSAVGGLSQFVSRFYRILTDVYWLTSANISGLHFLSFGLSRDT